MTYRKISIDRFYDKVTIVSESGCWIWTGAVSNGYGSLKVDGQNIRAHRFSYEVHCGEIEDGNVICHSCDVPLCVNPDHLWSGTQSENILDCSKKGRHVANRAKLSAEQKNEILSIYTGKHGQQSELARLYNVSQATIWNIVNNKGDVT
jgi:hypothetical protein